MPARERYRAKRQVKTRDLVQQYEEDLYLDEVEWEDAFVVGYAMHVDESWREHDYYAHWYWGEPEGEDELLFWTWNHRHFSNRLEAKQC